MSTSKPGMDRAQLVSRAAEYIRTSTSMTVLDTEWQPDGSTLALVAGDRDTLVAILPSVRSISRDVPRIVIHRTRQLAVEWMTAHGSRGYDKVRVDYVAVLATATGGYTIEHVEGIG